MSKLVVWADRLTLPSDAANAGKPTAFFPQAITGGTIYLPATVLVDDAGNSIDAMAADPVGTERGLIVRSIAKRPGSHYRAITPEITLATAVGQNRIATLFHPSTVSGLIYRVKKITLHFKAKHTVGVGQYKVIFISAENATPGGTQVTPQALNRGAAASGALFRSAPTGTPLSSGQAMIGYTSSLAAITGGVTDMMLPLYTAETDKAQAMELRAGQAEGIMIYQDVTSILTTAPIVACEVEWSEEAN